MKFLGSMTKAICFTLILISIFWSVVFFQYPQFEEWNEVHLETQSIMLGIFSTFTGLIAISMFVMKRKMKKQHKNKGPHSRNWIYIYLHQHPLLIGVTTLVTALAHGFY